MINKNELIETLQKAGLSCFEVDIVYSDSLCNIYFKTNKISELIRFAETNNIKTVLYSYDYNTAEDYQITDDMLSECDKRLVKAIKTKVKEYNQLTSTLDYSKPAELNVYCLYQGCCFAISQEDTWIEDIGILLCDEKLEELLDACEDIKEEITAEEQHKIDQLKSKLREYLLTDLEFLQCTNQRSRRTFILKLMQEKAEYKKALPEYLEPIFFAENIWKELKAKKN